MTLVDIGWVVDGGAYSMKKFQPFPSLEIISLIGHYFLIEMVRNAITIGPKIFTIMEVEVIEFLVSLAWYCCLR